MLSSLSTLCNSLATLNCNEAFYGSIRAQETACFTLDPSYPLSTVTFSNCESSFNTQMNIHNEDGQKYIIPNCDENNINCNQCINPNRQQFTIPTQSAMYQQQYVLTLQGATIFDFGKYVIQTTCIEHETHEFTSTLDYEYGWDLRRELRFLTTWLGEIEILTTTPGPLTSSQIVPSILITPGNEYEYDQLAKLYKYCAGGFAVFLIVIATLSSIDAKFIRVNDYFKVGALFAMMLQTIDMMSDCFFAVEVSIQNKIVSGNDAESQDLFYYKLIQYGSIVFIILPSIIALFQLYFYAQKHWLNNDYVRSWLSQYTTLLLLISVITGSSFAAVSLLNSYIFQISIFDMGLTDKQLKGFNTRRLYSIVLVENIPQLFLQSYFLYLQNDFNAPITLSSIAFSIVSIIISIMSMTMLKIINKTQGCIIISMHIKGDCVEEQSSKCRTMSTKLKKRLAIIIGVDQNTMEIIKPSYIENGFALDIHIYVNNNNPSNRRNQKKNINYEKIFHAANENGKLGKVFQNNWELSDLPTITNITCDVIESKVIKKQMEHVSANTPVTEMVNESPAVVGVKDDIEISIQEGVTYQ